MVPGLDRSTVSAAANATLRLSKALWQSPVRGVYGYVASGTTPSFAAQSKAYTGRSPPSASGAAVAKVAACKVLRTEEQHKKGRCTQGQPDHYSALGPPHQHMGMNELPPLTAAVKIPEAVHPGLRADCADRRLPGNSNCRLNGCCRCKRIAAGAVALHSKWASHGW